MILKLIVHLVLISLLSVNLSADDKSPFLITIQGDSSYMNTFKARSEYKMAKSIQFCRGFYIPAKVKDWKCKRIGNKKSQCRATYQCKLIKKSFSRVTESKRAKQKLSKLPRVRKRFKMRIGKKPYSKLGLGKSAKVTSNAYVKDKNISKRRMNNSLKKVKKQVKNFDEFEALEREIEFKKRKEALLRNRQQKSGAQKQTVQEKIENNERDLEEELGFKESEEESEELAKAKEAFQEDSGNVEDESDSSGNSTRSLNWKIVSGSIVQVQDSFENSVTSIEFAWDPRYSITKDWSFRGNLGFHGLKVNTGLADESFTVIDYGVFIDYRIYGNIFVELGIGQQKWSSDVFPGSHGTFAMGIGYRPETKWLGYIDGIFYRYSSIGNDAENKEARFGLNIAF